MAKISILGTGYAGLCTGVGFALRENEVICVDISKEKVDKINNGTPPIYETGLEDALKNVVAGKKLRATTDISTVKDTDVTFIAVGTPSKSDGKIDLFQIEKASEQLANVLSSKEKYHVVVIKSTVLPGTTEKILIPRISKVKSIGKDVGIAMNPEFLREGRALEDFLKPDRIVIGEYDEMSGESVAKIYGNFNAPIIRVSLREAEMIKYASNAFLATKISFANEIGNMCKKLGIDTYRVMEAVGMDRRIGPHFLAAGSGFGGSCFPKDVSALVSMARELGIGTKIIENALKVNENQKTLIVDILEKRTPLKGKRVAVLGLAFKPDTDDIRDSVAVSVIKKLLEKGSTIAAYDPMAAENMKSVYPGIEYCKTVAESLKGSDACLILTEWEEFSELEDKDFNIMKDRVVIEGRRILNKSKVSSFEGVCW